MNITVSKITIWDPFPQKVTFSRVNTVYAKVLEKPQKINNEMRKTDEDDWTEAYLRVGISAVLPMHKIDQ